MAELESERSYGALFFFGLVRSREREDRREIEMKGDVQSSGLQREHRESLQRRVQERKFEFEVAFSLANFFIFLEGNCDSWLIFFPGGQKRCTTFGLILQRDKHDALLIRK